MSIKLEHPDKKHCVCRGGGIFQETVPPKYNFKGKAGYGPVQFPYQTKKCRYHNKNMAIKYPDGWPEEDLRQWCKDNGVPEPWPADYLVAGQILYSGTITIANPKFHNQLYGFTVDPAESNDVVGNKTTK